MTLRKDFPTSLQFSRLLHGLFGCGDGVNTVHRTKPTILIMTNPVMYISIMIMVSIIEFAIFGLKF